MPGALTGTALGLRSQKGASVVIDNIAIYAGDGSKITPDFSAYGFKGLDPVVETTEAETTACLLYTSHIFILAQRANSQESHRDLRRVDRHKADRR